MGQRQGAMEDVVIDRGFWRGRHVLVTGHTGFKGAWLARWLGRLGAKVHALALAPATAPNLHALLAPSAAIQSHFVDIRERNALARVIAEAAPEVVFHLAAQSLVPVGYRAPVETFDTNVLGTLHVLAAVAKAPAPRAVLVATSDKVYANTDSGRAFIETDRLGGDDPYSASKAACELAVAAWRSSAAAGPSIATARAGNVIGGGDWASDRLVPDLVRALAAGAPLVMRRATATRPWQHVLDPLAGYLAYAQRLAAGERQPPALNFGPPPEVTCDVARLVERLCESLGRRPSIVHAGGGGMAEKRVLALDSSLARQTLGWRARLDLETTLAWTGEWYAAHAAGADVARLTDAQIERYEALV